jgi:hypothetical protein
MLSLQLLGMRSFFVCVSMPSCPRVFESVFRCPHVPMSLSSNVPTSIFLPSNVSIFQCFYLPTFLPSNAPTFRCPYLPMFLPSIVPIFQCLSSNVHVALCHCELRVALCSCITAFKTSLGCSFCSTIISFTFGHPLNCVLFLAASSPTRFFSSSKHEQITPKPFADSYDFTPVPLTVFACRHGRRFPQAGSRETKRRQAIARGSEPVRAASLLLGFRHLYYLGMVDECCTSERVVRSRYSIGMFF